WFSTLPPHTFPTRRSSDLSVGHVSATSVAPVFHSPPMPSPSRNRATANIAMLFASPDANEQSEYVRMLAISACLRPIRSARNPRSEEHTSELQSRGHLVCH